MRVHVLFVCEREYRMNRGGGGGRYCGLRQKEFT